MPLLRNWRKWHSCPLDRGLWTSMTRTKGLAAAAARECVEATNQQRSLLLLTTMTNPSLYEGQRSEYVRASLFAARSCSSDQVTGPVQCLAACVSKIEQALTGVVLKFWRIRFAGDRKQFPLKLKLHAQAWMVECSNQMFLSMGTPPFFEPYLSAHRLRG